VWCRWNHSPGGVNLKLLKVPGIPPEMDAAFNSKKDLLHLLHPNMTRGVAQMANARRYHAVKAFCRYGDSVEAI